MRFLADESFDFNVVRARRAEGHAVTSVSEIAGGPPDERILELAVEWEGHLLHPPGSCPRPRQGG